MNKLINCLDWITPILLLVLLGCILFIPKQKEETVEPAIPSNYHIFYDDENKMIIVPKDYHFESDSKGNMVLTKEKTK